MKQRTVVLYMKPKVRAHPLPPTHSHPRNTAHRAVGDGEIVLAAHSRVHSDVQAVFKAVPRHWSESPTAASDIGGGSAGSGGSAGTGVGGQLHCNRQESNRRHRGDSHCEAPLLTWETQCNTLK